MEQDFHFIKDRLQRSAGALADLLLPRYCLVCGRRLSIDERHLCIWCWADFPYTRNWRECHNNMADRYNGLLINREEETAGGRYQYAAALFFYQEHNNYRRITQSLKYKADLPAGRFFGTMLGERLRENWGKGADLVIPIPLHWTRKWSRGYNQAAVIAGAVAGVLDIPMISDGLQRARKTETQTRVSTDEKRRNVDGAFRTNENRMRVLEKAEHIILVDDVFTTGATMCSAYSALRETLGPVPRISAVTLACVQQ